MKMNFKKNIFGFIIWLLPFGFLQAQGIIIQGSISDASDKSALIGANIVEVDENGRYIGATTADNNGNFILKVSSKDAELQISFIGYIKQSFKVGTRTRFDVELEPETMQMEEVVIAGKKLGNDGVISIRDRAVSVARIELDELQSSMTTTVEELLQGRLGNVDITQLSGDPGAGLNIRIRGTASLNAKNSPLIVVNGIPYEADIDESFDFAQADIDKFGNLIDVAPEDIESIEVLKDAASTAIWGSKASNGVLMIQTKRGVRSAPVFNYTFKRTRSEEPDPIPLLDGPGYARLITDAHFNVDWNTFESDEIAFRRDWENYWNFNQNTNWMDEITQRGYVNQHNFSVRGGGVKSKYNISLGYQDEEGTTIGTALQKINMSTSLDYELSSKLQFKTDIMFTRYDQDATYDRQIGSVPYGWDPIRSKAYKKMPNMSVYERDTNNIPYNDYFIPDETIQGTSKEYYNPVAYANEASNKIYKNNARALFNLRYKPIQELDLSSTITLDIFDNKTHQFLPFEAIGYNYEDNITDRSYISYIKNSSIYTMNRIIYNPKFGDNHNVIFRGQFDTQERIQKSFESETSHSGSKESRYPGENQNMLMQKTEESEFKLLGGFMDANYIYRDKYGIMGGVKAEGSSKFSPESRWGFFPTFSAFWRISNESFMQSIRFIDDLKFRGSWGQSGNAPGDNYLYFRRYSADTRLAYMTIPGVIPDNIELTKLKWEIIEQSNLGFSFFAMDNRMNIEFDIYNKRTKNLYIRRSSIPSSSGFDNISTNEGELLNKGWEVLFNYRIFQKKNWNFNIDLNASQNDNIVISLPENYSLEHGDMLANGNYKISVVPGEPLGGMFGYTYLGVYPTDEDAVVIDEYGNVVMDPVLDIPLVTTMGGSGYEFEGGDAKYEDKNHDGIINESDLIYLGDLNPDLMGGISPRLQIKGLTFNMFFYYKVGQKIINQARIDLEKMYDHNNQSQATNWRWRKQGDTTDIPRALYNSGYNWLGSSRFVEKGDFIRLKSVSLTYDVNNKICQKIFLKEMKVFFSGYNLYTWTGYTGQDPDVGQPTKPDDLPKDGSRTPPSIRYTIGVSVKF